MDSPLVYKRTYLQAIQIAQEENAEYLVVHCTCSDKVHAQRLHRRKAEVYTHQITSWEALQVEKVKYEQFETENEICVNTEQPLEESILTIINHKQVNRELTVLYK
jgi:predicted kinase